jgi:DNA repair protein SbcD/Mre11
VAAVAEEEVMGIRILHVADVHLGRSFSQYPEIAAQRKQDLVGTFERICDVALIRKVAAVLIAGDLFDKKDPGPDLIGVVQGGLDRLIRDGIRVFIIPGNHDDVWYEHSVWRSATFAGAHVFTDAAFSGPQTFDANGTSVSIHGVAYSRTVCPSPLASLQHDSDGIHIGVLHATVDAPAHFPDLQRFFPLTSTELAHAGFDYVALGHIHRGHDIKAGGRILGRYPGSPEGLDLTETGPRHVALLDFNGTTPVTELIKVNTREVRAETLDASELTQEDVVGQLRERANASDLVSINLTGNPKDMIDCDAVKKRLQNEYFWLELHDATEMIHSEVIDRWLGRQNTIGGRFVRTLREQIVAAHNDDDRVMLELALKMGLLSLEKRSA